MGSMSGSDAAPLPRLGEVYFDVRGESRSMRLSWYADTGVAVFSIWQGSTCTGTFRLPIADLPRMVEALQRGPERAPAPERARPSPEHRDELDPGYQGSHSSGRHRAARYSGRDYPADPLAPDHPTRPSASSYAGAADTRGYPASPLDPGYSPAQPYVAPDSMEAGLPGEAGAHEPRDYRDRWDDDTSAGFLPLRPAAPRVPGLRARAR
jgi:hypothetical protein